MQVLRGLSDPPAPSSDHDLNHETGRPPDKGLRAAGVLVAVIGTKDAAQVLLTKRASGLKHHPGQIAFPGGKQDRADPDITATALREAREEVGLKTDSVEVLGHLPGHQTVTGFAVTPVLARIHGPFRPRPEAGEVDEIFTVPLSHLMTLGAYRVEQRRWRGAWRRYYVVPYGPYYIWGATARILRNMADMARP